MTNSRHHHRRLAVIAARGVKRFAAIAAARAGRTDSVRKQRFRPLTEAETEAILGVELLAALSGVRRHAS